MTTFTMTELFCTHFILIYLLKGGSNDARNNPTFLGNLFFSEQISKEGYQILQKSLVCNFGANP